MKSNRRYGNPFGSPIAQSNMFFWRLIEDPLSRLSLLICLRLDDKSPLQFRHGEVTYHFPFYPEGTHGTGTGGNIDYYGPCPPDREHRYFFKVYALDAELDLPEKTTKQGVERAMESHVIAKAELMGRYERI